MDVLTDLPPRTTFADSYFYAQGPVEKPVYPSTASATPEPFPKP